MAEEPAEGEVVEGEQPPPPGEGEEPKEPEWCKELSREQLTAFYKKAASNEEALRYMALEILKLPEFTYDGNVAVALDYFVGILMFAQGEQLSAPHTLLMYQLGMELMEGIKSGNCLQCTEETFQNLIFKWSVKVKNATHAPQLPTIHAPQLTTIELQKIIPFFMDTVIQHHRLFTYCFNRESLHYRYNAKVWIETPAPWGWEPLRCFDTMEELEKDKFAKAEYERELAEWEAERLAAKAEAKGLPEAKVGGLPEAEANVLPEDPDLLTCCYT